MRESVALRFLYKTAPGRAILKVLVHPAVSRAAGALLSSGVSKCIVPCYILRHKIDMHNIEIPPRGFASFNDFFTRRRKCAGFDRTPGHLISPCDGLLTCLDIREDTVLEIKNTEYSLGDLLRDSKLAAKFRGGQAFIFRLTPSHYHRYCHVAEGRVLCSRKIPGKLHCVRPIALETTPVFVQNSREYQVIRTREFATLVQMEVGALLVGKISNPPGTDRVRAGQEKGYFEFGGSTVILLVQKDAVQRSEKLFRRTAVDGEIPVKMGECIAVRRQTCP